MVFRNIYNGKFNENKRMDAKQARVYTQKKFILFEVSVNLSNPNY